MKDVWRSVSMRLGVLFVMAPGQPMMPMLPVDNWDMLPQVYFQAKPEMQSSIHYFSIQERGPTLMPSLVLVLDLSTLTTSFVVEMRIV